MGVRMFRETILAVMGGEDVMAPLHFNTRAGTVKVGGLAPTE